MQRDNCTHCVACPPYPAHAHWSGQNDRFDCMWLCDEEYQLHNMTCVAIHHSPVTALVQLQPVCDPGQMAVNFLCVSCFEAAAQGHMQMQDLPLPADVNIKWQWSYGCAWQCNHAAGYWELRPESGEYWECTSYKMHSVMLRGVDMSWAAAHVDNTSADMGTSVNLDTSTDTSMDTSVNMNSSSNIGSRRQSSSGGRTLYFILGVVISVPVLVLVCMVIVGVARSQWSPDLSGQRHERQPLLNV